MWHTLVDTPSRRSEVFRQNGNKPFVSPNTYIRREAQQQGNYQGVGIERYGRGPVGNPMGHHHKLVFDGERKLRNANSRALAKNAAIVNLNDDLTIAASLFEDWYERQQSYRLVGNVIGEILDFTRNWKKPQYWKRKKSSIEPSSLPEAWLAYQFGIKPLMGTLDRALTGLAQPLASCSFKGASMVTYSNSVIGSDVNHACGDGNIYGNVNYRYIVGCRVSPNLNPNTPLLGLTGLNQPFSSAWSVVPWGWATDYIVNVNEVLTNLEVQHPGLHISDWYETEVISVSHWGQLIYNQYAWWLPNAIYIPQTIANISGSSFNMERRPLSRPPQISWSVKFPLLGSNKPANLASALALTMKGKKNA